MGRSSATSPEVPAATRSHILLLFAPSLALLLHWAQTVLQQAAAKLSASLSMLFASIDRGLAMAGRIPSAKAPIHYTLLPFPLPPPPSLHVQCLVVPKVQGPPGIPFLLLVAGRIPSAPGSSSFFHVTTVTLTCALLSSSLPPPGGWSDPVRHPAPSFSNIAFRSLYGQSKAQTAETSHAAGPTQGTNL